ncbi:hypothetical protein ACIQRK_37835, partial [Streptomyces anulatus]
RHHAQPCQDRLNHQVKHHYDPPTPTLLQQPLEPVSLTGELMELFDFPHPVLGDCPGMLAFPPSRRV